MSKPQYIEASARNPFTGPMVLIDPHLYAQIIHALRDLVRTDDEWIEAVTRGMHDSGHIARAKEHARALLAELDKEAS